MSRRLAWAFYLHLAVGIVGLCMAIVPVLCCGPQGRALWFYQTGLLVVVGAILVAFAIVTLDLLLGIASNERQP